MLAGVEEDDVSALAVDFAASPEVLDACPRAVPNGAANVTKSATSASIPAQELTRLRGFTRDFSLIGQPNERVASQNGGTLHVDALDHHFQLFDVR